MVVPAVLVGLVVTLIITLTVANNKTHFFGKAGTTVTTTTDSIVASDDSYVDADLINLPEKL
ncbi:hypothetical protein A2872_02560 [Candidatus Gottesmanbacteria bacterium RIFCSPHIGHO2_01_FULL_42_12]|uniref:Uncharacterized protein n=1 Tax=Candidatus Gottesmanbacteria bacterium RIFCSPHIGHO2_01_FULL_42_12 TaxID=1798377 RepID=A0A1F5Z4T5_9BACT|nr:MAG: hypothetical protein A2872_02560 [Candidatus Gottesmanbacteria bacterium RIFCSPHIGHO2_01_FULL_42_12]